MKKWIDCTELALESGNGQVESLRVKIRGQANKGNLMVSVYDRLLHKEEPADERSYFSYRKHHACRH